MSSAPFINLRGYAAPFAQIGRPWKGRAEFFDPSCFNDQLANTASKPVFLNYGTHDSDPICGSINLFKDYYGLGFTCTVSKEAWRGIAPGVMSDCQFCSINVTEEEAVPFRLDGELCYHIVRARIDHVCLCASPVFQGTGAWPAKFNGVMPPRLARLAATWADGRRLWLCDQERAAAERAREALIRKTARAFRALGPQRIEAVGHRELRSGSPSTPSRGHGRTFRGAMSK